MAYPLQFSDEELQKMTTSIDVDNSGVIDKGELKIFVLELLQANRNIQFKEAEMSPLYKQENREGIQKDIIWKAYLERNEAQ